MDTVYMVILSTGVLIWLQINIKQVTCQCDDYRNAVDTNSEGFLRWEVILGPNSGECPPDAYNITAVNKCYYLAKGGVHGDRALLVSPCFTTSSSEPKVTLSFAYFLSEYNTGTLNVYWRDGCSQTPLDNGNIDMVGTLIKEFNNETNGWLLISYELDLQAKVFQIVFEAVMEGEKNNSIAVDNISVDNATVYRPITTTESTSSLPLTVATKTSTMTTSTTPSKDSTVAGISQANVLPPINFDATSPGTSRQASLEQTMPTLTTSSQTQLPADTATTTDTTGLSETSNVTLNFCDKNLIVGGLDNCTFIGLMFAIVPLAIIFLIWATCFVYNRYCITFFDNSDKHQQDDQDAENSMAPKDNYSGTYAYVNSTTDHTYASCHPIRPPDNDASSKKGGLTGKKATPSTKYEMRIMNQDTNEQNGMVGVKDSASNDYQDTLPKAIGKSNEDQTSVTSVGDKDTDTSYAVLNRTTSEETDTSYTSLNKAKNEDSNPVYDVLNEPSSSGLSEITADETTISPDETSEILNTEESPYHVLEGPTPPSPPNSPIPTLRKNKKHENTDIPYDVVNEVLFPPQIDSRTLLVATDQIESERIGQGQEESPYHVLDGPTPPSPPNSPIPTLRRSNFQQTAAESCPNDDAYDLVGINAPGNALILTAEAKSDQKPTDIEPYADTVISLHDERKPIVSGNKENYDNEEDVYEHVGKPGKEEKSKTMEASNINTAYDDGYDRPRIPAVQAIDVYTVDNIDSDVSDDTYL